MLLGLVFGTRGALAEDLIIKISTDQTIEEIGQRIELHSGTYNLTIFGSMRFNDYPTNIKDKKKFATAVVELIAPHWVRKVEKIDANALLLFPLRILIVEVEDGSEVSFYNLKTLLKSIGFKNKDLIKEFENIDFKFRYFLRTALR